MHQAQKSIKRVGIVGLGLIGGSLGLDLQAQGLQVNGLVHRSSTAKRAKERGLAQEISTEPEVLSDCDLIILALPINQLLTPSKELTQALPKDAVITDVGSIKAPILKVWREIHEHFVPSHPMAGTEQSGVEAGHLNLFRDRPWVVTPEKNTTPIALEKINELASRLGCKWIVSRADLHDKAVALVSHLPIIIGASLLDSLSQETDQSLLDLAKHLVSSGFEDTSRVGGGSPELGTSIISNNSKDILETIKSYKKTLDNFERIILLQDWEKLNLVLKKTNSLRSEIIQQ